MSYCPKCGSRLYSGDQEYIDATGVCSYCVSFDSTTDKRFRKKYDEYQKAKEKQQNRRRKKNARSFTGTSW